jgi:hypothetical protein
MTAVERVDRRFRLHPGNVLLHCFLSLVGVLFLFLVAFWCCAKMASVHFMVLAVPRQNGVYGPLFVSWWFSLFFPVSWTLSFVVVVVVVVSSRSVSAIQPSAVFARL